tara:strand:+ start:1392 stop:1613 length:222 start_codon:yes stop_codon:yes gene_type:complete
MDKSFLDNYPPELTQGAYRILDKIKTEEDEDMRVKLYGQLAMVLEQLKMKLDTYDSTDNTGQSDVEVTTIGTK